MADSIANEGETSGLASADPTKRTSGLASADPTKSSAKTQSFVVAGGPPSATASASLPTAAASHGAAAALVPAATPTTPGGTGTSSPAGRACGGRAGCQTEASADPMGSSALQAAQAVKVTTQDNIPTHPPSPLPPT